ncbi:hypothetical protein IFM61606_09489 [Aspergillus udagawae]|uniref:Rhodopsin domain-containing protein n=1 Tax=Aspergillus udagawae TaxID=91492 RepID=A0ABQ1AJL1_9EURO|nr:hypothetical protein IFM61606_09489 [Aspergillus udagawae]GFF46550.1 hypothetical protein IFM51744_06349 [Aspergillus udagawae]GFF83108.1 hypothetical protein IFM53868_03697 [Aspergillus udagawae]GFG05121.1 hypothetical protein IFM5058_02268 [Aspergillus udagawae]
MHLSWRAAQDAAFLAQSRVTEVTVAYSIPIPLELLTTGLRIWVKLRGPGNVGLSSDDYLMLWATFVGAAVCVSGLIYGPPYGFGRHKAALSDEQIETFMMGNYIFSHFYNAAIASTKLAVLALYYRIFVTLKFRIVVLTTAVFVILWLMTMEILLGLQCRPISRFWDPDVPGKCLNLVEFTYFTNVINLVTDIWIFSLPLPVIFKLQMSRNRKIALSFLFSIGLATCAISAARLSVVITQGSSDFTWAGVPLGILSAWEPLGGIFCANLPIIYRAVVTMLRNLKGSVSGQPSRTGDPNSQPYRDAEQSHRPWATLYNGSGAQMDYHSEASATKARGEVAELRSISGNAIQVDQYFEQQVYHEGEETPLRPVRKGSS